jgi:hypothetical protein
VIACRATQRGGPKTLDCIPWSELYRLGIATRIPITDITSVYYAEIMVETRVLTIDTAVGVTFGKRQHYIRNLVPGQPLRLVREPNNPFDANAVAIWDTSDHLLGYLDCHLAATLAPAFKEAGPCVPARVHSVGRCTTWGPYGFRFEYELERTVDAPSRKRTHASIYS